MKNVLLGLLLVLFGCVVTAQPSLEGSWHGNLQVMGTTLPLVIHIKKEKTGHSGSFDSPAQKAFGIPATEVVVTDGQLLFKQADAGISYRGDWREGDSIVGVFTQMGRDMLLHLKRLNQGEQPVMPAKPKRVQQPSAPIPYQVKEVKFKNKSAGIQLAGTLTLPDGKGPFPGVVLISGSGPQNRNSEVFDHAPFLVLADYLTRQGIAVLRYDDRGVAESGGSFSGATSADFATDAAAAWDFLRKQKGIDKARVGFAGHSEGGMIAPLAYALRPETGFLVLLAGVGMPVHELLLEQLQAVGAAEGLSQAEIDSQLQINTQLFRWMRELSPKDAEANFRTWSEEQLFLVQDEEASKRLETQLNATRELFTDPWFMYFIQYDPHAALKAVRCPVLAMNGSKDVQVLSTSNLAGIERSLKAGGNAAVTVVEMPGLNHLFQPCESCSVSEYSQLEITFDPAAMQRIAEWVGKYEDRR